MRIYLIRHGETPGNREGRYLGGRTDESLSERGRGELSEMEDAPGVVFSSPMKRALETANILFPGVKPEAVEGLREIDFGDFENKAHAELDGNADYQAWIDSGGARAFPGGESREAFVQRTLSAFSDIVKNGQSCAVVAHGGTIMAVMSALTGKDYFDFQVKNGQGYALVLERREQLTGGQKPADNCLPSLEKTDTEMEKNFDVVSYRSISCRISD